MQLGIVMTDESYVAQVVGLLDAAHARGWQTVCFLTDTGVNVLAHEDCIERAKARPNTVSLCEHSVQKHAADTIDLAAHADFVVVGGQYQNAELARKCDKVLVF
jgi:peroxiredoxin family protein